MTVYGSGEADMAQVQLCLLAPLAANDAEVKRSRLVAETRRLRVNVCQWTIPAP